METRRFDEEFARDVYTRIRNLPDDVVPRWGRMRKADLLEHFLAALGNSLGEATFDIPLQSAAWVRTFLKWLILTVEFPMLRNVQFKDREGKALPLARSKGSLMDLKAMLERVARAGAADVPAPPPHPWFGRLTFEEWKLLHVRHIRHHLKQFGAPL